MSPGASNIYRCDYSNDKAWQRMLHLIDETVRDTLGVNESMDLYSCYRPVIVNDKKSLEGETSHDVRDRFIAWVAEELLRVISRKKFFAHEEFSTTGLRREWTLGTRYNFCLLVDDICIESLDEMKYPVVKLLWGQWGPLEPHERNYAVHPDFEDYAVNKPTILLYCLYSLPEDVQSYDSRVTLDTTATNVGPLTTPFIPPSTCCDIQTRLYRTWCPRLEIVCQGPYGNDCCPDKWRENVYYSPGMCPSGYYGCTLPTSKQRQETTNICCPEHFDCVGQHLCTRRLNNPQIITIVVGISTREAAYVVTATPIQICFRAAESTVVPVPIDSLSLPRGESAYEGKGGHWGWSAGGG